MPGCVTVPPLPFTGGRPPVSSFGRFRRGGGGRSGLAAQFSGLEHERYHVRRRREPLVRDARCRHGEMTDLACREREVNGEAERPGRLAAALDEPASEGASVPTDEQPGDSSLEGAGTAVDLEA